VVPKILEASIFEEGTEGEARPRGTISTRTVKSCTSKKAVFARNLDGRKGIYRRGDRQGNQSKRDEMGRRRLVDETA